MTLFRLVAVPVTLLLTALAARAQTFDISDVSNSSCGRSTVTIDASSVPATAGFDFDFTYDAAVVKPVSVARGTLTTNCDFAANLNVSGTVSVSFACLTAVSGTGSVAVVTFDAIKPGTSALAFSFCQRDETTCTSPTGGSIALSGCPTIALSPSTTGALPGTSAGSPGRACIGAALTAGVTAVTKATVDFSYASSDFSLEACTTSQALVDLGKTVSTTAVSAGVTRVTVSGGSATIPTGPLFVCTMLVPNTTAYGTYNVGNSPQAFDVSDVPVGVSSAGSSVKVTNCNGDCDGSGGVTLAEVQRALNEYGGTPFCNPTFPTLSCPAADSNTSGGVILAEVQQSLNRFSNGCPALP